MAAALEAYGYGQERDRALARMADAERETLILHELGEHAAGRLLGEAWERFMDGIDDRRVEITARAVRDLLADTLVTLPSLLERDALPSLHFWFATFSGMRRELFPRLSSAQAAWNEGRGLEALRDAIDSGREHWLRIALEMAADAEAAARFALDPRAIALA